MTQPPQTPLRDVLMKAPTSDERKDLLIARTRGEVSALSRAIKYAPSTDIAAYLEKRLFWAKVRLKKAHNS